MSIHTNALSKKDLEVLVESGNELAAKINLNALLQHIVDRACKMTESPDGSIILYNEQRQTLYFAMATGEDADVVLTRWGEFSEQQVPVEGSKAGAVFKSGEALVEDHLSDHFEEVDKQRKSKKRTTSMICVPLTAYDIRLEERRLGVMQILNKQSKGGAPLKYSTRDLQLLTQFANQAALAIRNAKLIRDLLAQMGLFAARGAGEDTTDLLNELKHPAYSERMSLMFVDMRGFTRLGQVANSPQLTVQLLNEFLTMVSEQIIEHGGVVNKFLGDGVLALFRRQAYAERAIRCAFAIVESFRKLRDSWKQKIAARINFLDVGIGIATDDVILGTVGSSRVRDYTAIGMAVNRAAAFEQCARGGKFVLIDHTTYEAVKDLVGEAEAPVEYELKKPDQAHGIFYDQYHIKSLKPAAGIAAPALRSSLFISHSKNDRVFVLEKLVAPLTKEYGLDAWYFEADINPSEKWIESIAQGLRKCDWMVVVVSKHAAASPWVKEEVTLALSKLDLKDKIIPVVLDDTPLETINDFLISRQAIFVANEANVAERIDQTLTLWNDAKAAEANS